MGEELLLYDSQRNRTHYLNPTAAVIWELCDGTRTPQEIAEEILKVLPVDRERVLSDVERTLHQFAQKHILMTLRNT